MNSNNGRITIAGKEYDAVTGMPITDKAPHVESVSHNSGHSPSHNVHARPMRSTTLHRRATKKPEPAVTRIEKPKQHVQHSHPTNVQTHHQVRRFAPHPTGAIKPSGKTMDIGPARVSRPVMDMKPAQKPVHRAVPSPDVHVQHPHVVKAHAKSLQKSQSQSRPHVPAKTINQQAIQNAIEKVEKPKPLKKRFNLRNKLVGVFSAVIAVVMLGGYFTYLNMPNLSVRVAAMHAGVNAEYPSYNPDGYSLNGPIKFADGRVSLAYKSNGGPQNYTISQSRSDWNNEAVLDNYVNPRAGTNYIPYTERGLVIYTYENNAAWVNGGILYTIEGNAPLSSEQIRRIATSLL